MSTTATEPTPESALMIATCRTPGCKEEGRPYRARFYANSVAPTWRGLCMSCEQTVTDIVPAT
ncbi:hypothetical protein [Streptomyces longispororuber]|uniref:hypothetical protein n=1 Tax=Streptomyces longispororuber TaxID=68230 RepID=UPI0036FBCC9C